MANRQSLRYLRRLRDMTQAELAEKAGVHKVTISKYETGAMTPSLVVLQRLAGALGVEMSEIELPSVLGAA